MILRRSWNRIREACEIVLADGIFFGVCLLMLAILQPLIEFLPISDYQKDAIERLHYHALTACMLVAGAAMVLHVIDFSMGRSSKHES